MAYGDFIAVNGNSEVSGWLNRWMAGQASRSPVRAVALSDNLPRLLRGLQKGFFGTTNGTLVGDERHHHIALWYQYQQGVPQQVGAVMPDHALRHVDALGRHPTARIVIQVRGMQALEQRLLQ